VQRKLSHPNIVKISDASYDKERNSTLIAMEYVDNGTLF
jgi:serine/threonine protein kinase